jgi:hypothetical protein
LEPQLLKTEIEIKPKLTTIDEATKFTADFVKNPPQTPIEMVKFAASAFETSSVVSQALSVAFPGVATVLPAVGAIFSLFSGGGPSIGEVTLNAIAQVSKQIQKGFEAVNDTILRSTERLTKVTEFQAQRTIDSVISGVNELAKEQSAVQVYKTFTASAILDNVEKQKAEIYADYIDTLNQQRQQWISDIKDALRKAQNQTNAQYEFVQAQIANIAGGLFYEIKSGLEKAADDAKELLEIQRQIDEINSYIADDSLVLLADQLVRGYFGIATESKESRT